jgi:hypothetical protein
MVMRRPGGIALAIGLLVACGGGASSSPASTPSEPDGGDGGGDATSPLPTPPGTLANGSYKIHVPMPDGTSDDVWLYATSPDGAGPLPVVVYAHGKGVGADLVNCQPNGGIGDEILGPDSVTRTNSLASLGYLAVAIAYRNTGDGAPGIGTIKLRDEEVRDTRALLAAAQWARREHRRGSPRAAFIGSSMGTWPAFWGVTARKDLADLQADLDLRTTILVAETANHPRNHADAGSYGKLSSAVPLERAGAIGGAVFNVLHSSMLATGQATVTQNDLSSGAYFDIASSGLTARGLDLARGVFLAHANPSLGACNGPGQTFQPPICSTDCALMTLQSLVPGGGQDPGPATDWLTQAALDAQGYWSLTPVDPGPTPANVFLRADRNGSPALAATGPLKVSRALSLLAINDGHYDAAAQALLIAKLTALGAKVPSPPRIDVDGQGVKCTHDGYLDATRACGFALIRDELAAAFAP